jgi:hypothetical protein
MRSIAYVVLTISAICLLTSGCTPYHAQGITAGALVGGVAGALIDHGEPARGALIGGTLGGFAGGTMAEMSYRTSREPYYYDYGGRRDYPRDSYYYPYPRYR